MCGLVRFSCAPVSNTPALFTLLDGLFLRLAAGNASPRSMYEALSTESSISWVGLFSGLVLSHPSANECTECGSTTVFGVLPDWRV